MLINGITKGTNFSFLNIGRTQGGSGVSCPNLAPLAKDTVSFKGSAKLVGAHMAFAPSERICKQAEQNAEPARFYLQLVMDKYLGGQTKEDGDEGAISYSTRIKKGTSIREKVISTCMKRYCADVSVLAEQITKGLSEYYPIREGFKEENLFPVVKQEIISLNQTNDKISPYNFIDYFVEEAENSLNDIGLMDIKSTSKKQRAKIRKEISEKIADTPEAKKSLERLYVKPSTIAGVKYYANDIVGGRVIIHNSNEKSIAELFNGLQQAVDDGKLKITSIENNIPDSKKLPHGKQASDYAYAEDSTLEKLAESSGAEYKINKSKSGYLSVHINIDLSNELFKDYGGSYNGYTGEIQILGSDVEKLKEVEDLCYKFKDDKNSVHPIYKPFKDTFTTYYNDETKEAFDDYTYYLYLHQREIEPGIIDYEEFPSPEELGFGDSIPVALDFNNLRKIKKSCDRELEHLLMSKNLVLSKDITPAGVKKEIKRQGDIRTLKNLISYDIK